MAEFEDQTVSRAAAQQYEMARHLGIFNMYDRIGVGSLALDKGWHELADIAADRGRYAYLLENYPALMAGYGINTGDPVDTE